VHTELTQKRVEVLQKMNATRIERVQKAEEKASKEVKTEQDAQAKQLTAQQGMEQVTACKLRLSFPPWAHSHGVSGE